MNLSLSPFSFFGSYMSISYTNNELWLQSLHGKSKGNMNSIKILIIHDNKPVSYNIDCSYTLIKLSTDYGEVKICFDSSEKLVFHSTSNQLSIRLDISPKYNFEYSYLLNDEKSTYCIVNSYKNLTKYLVFCNNGSISLSQTLNVDSSGSAKEAENISYIDIHANKDGFYFAIQDIPTNMLLPSKIENFDSICSKSKVLFSDFVRIQKPVQEKYSKTKDYASYIIWSSTVRAQGYLKYNSVYASNKDFPGVWSWDHCFNAIGLAPVCPELAWEQMATVFEHQDIMGQIPGSVSDSTIRWNFSKPPVHGYFFSLMMKYIDFSKEQLELIENWISKQINFYLNFKDCNKDGICEYHHGNDCGQDNSTVFNKHVVVDCPDLTAFIIKAMDLLENVCKKLNKFEQALSWKNKADELTNKFHEYFIYDNLPVARETLSGNTIKSGSILPYISLILAERLQPNVRKNMIQHIKDLHLTQYGISTERLDSKFYENDAYWRGPIWAPSTLLLVEALIDCNEDEFALDISKRFCNMVDKYGFAENFDAKTGLGLRDKSFCWTASVFLFLAGMIQEKEDNNAKS